MLKQNFFLILFFSFYCLSNQILLFSEESQLLYNKPKSYELNLKDFLKKGGDNILHSPIIISVQNKNEASTKIKIISKLNFMPTLESFDHSDFIGINGIYSISYSPCEFDYNKDKIYVHIISEKDQDTSYRIDINNLDNTFYETICTNTPKKIQKQILLYIQV